MPVTMVKRIGKRLPKKANLEQLKAEIRRTAMDTAKFVQKSYEVTVVTWVSRPTFPIIDIYTPDMIGFTVGYEDNIYKFLDWGTDERWALMSDDWTSKTSPNSMFSGAGSGHAAIRGMGAMTKHGLAARPGIEARGWTKMIIQNNKLYFKVKMKDAFRRATGRLF